MNFHSSPTSTLKAAMKCHVNGVSRLHRKQGRPQGPQPGSHHQRPQGPGARAPSAAAARARAAFPREVTQGHSLPAARSARAFFPSPSSSAPATRPTLLPHSPREAGSQRRKPRPGTAELGFSSEPVRGGFPRASSTLLHGSAAAALAASPGPPRLFGTGHVQRAAAPPASPAPRVRPALRLRTRCAGGLGGAPPAGAWGHRLAAGSSGERAREAPRPRRGNITQHPPRFRPFTQGGPRPRERRAVAVPACGWRRPS